MTPRQQREARTVVTAFLRDAGCGLGRECFADDEKTRRLHDRARLFLKLTAPKPARRKKA